MSLANAARAMAVGMVLVALPIQQANATAITWNFQDVAMSGGTSLEGTFTTDATLQLTAWDIQVVGGPNSGYHFSNLIANYAFENGPQTYGITNDGTNYIDWSFVDPLSAS